MAVVRTQHALYSQCCMDCVLFINVVNMRDVRKSVMSGELEATLLKTQLILDPLMVIMAGNKAIHLLQHQKMTTRNVHSEVLFCLSPSKNISESFRLFGVSDNDNSVLAVFINGHDGINLKKLQQKVEGQQTDLSHLPTLSDMAAIRKIYKLTDAESSSGSSLEAVITKIASKDCL